MRILSLLPAATEMVAYLGLADSLCGISHECDYPPEVVGLPRVTRSIIPADASAAEIDAIVRERANLQASLYELDADWVAELRPDWIITQTLCDVCAVADADVERAIRGLAHRPQVVNLQPQRWADVIEGLRQIAEAVGVADRAESRIAGLLERVERVRQRTVSSRHSRRSVVVLEWLDPPFTAGHWTPEWVEVAGGCELLGQAGMRSRPTDWQTICEADPDLLLIACCGWEPERTRRELPLSEAVVSAVPELAELACVRTERVYLADGNAYFNRPGPRLVDSLEILAHAIDPKTHPLPEALRDRAAVPVRLVV